jgi:hypothetical protein
MSVNRNVPPINQPITNLDALVVIVTQLRQGMESLGGMRGGPLDRAVTLNDLIALGLVDAATVQAKLP